VRTLVPDVRSGYGVDEASGFERLSDGMRSVCRDCTGQAESGARAYT
jgi:hypothetical protein